MTTSEIIALLSLLVTVAFDAFQVIWMLTGKDKDKKD